MFSGHRLFVFNELGGHFTMFEYSLHLAAMRICEWFRWLNAMCGASGNDGLGSREAGRSARCLARPRAIDPDIHPPPIVLGGRAGDVRCALGWNEEEGSPGPGSTAGPLDPGSLFQVTEAGGQEGHIAVRAADVPVPYDPAADGPKVRIIKRATKSIAAIMAPHIRIFPVPRCSGARDRCFAIGCEPQ